MTDGLTVQLFCDFHIDIGMTLNLLQCYCVSCWMLSHTMPYNAKTSLALLPYTVCRSYVTELLSQYNQLRFAPNISWIHVQYVSVHSQRSANLFKFTERRKIKCRLLFLLKNSQFLSHTSKDILLFLFLLILFSMPQTIQQILHLFSCSRKVPVLNLLLFETDPLKQGIITW